MTMFKTVACPRCYTPVKVLATDPELGPDSCPNCEETARQTTRGIEQTLSGIPMMATTGELAELHRNVGVLRGEQDRLGVKVRALATELADVRGQVQAALAAEGD